MSYKGSDLSNEFKKWFRTEKTRIKKILVAKGCTDIKLDYGFYYFSGFFTSPTGQIYYISSLDVRGSNDRYYYRTAESYKDFTGGMNQWIKPSELKTIKLK